MPRRFQYSTRTLILVMLAMGLICAFGPAFYKKYRAYRSEREQERLSQEQDQVIREIRVMKDQLEAETRAMNSRP